MYITKIRQNIIAEIKVIHGYWLGRDTCTYKMISKVNLKRYIVNNSSKMRKFKMAVISLYKKYKCSYLHPQMSSV